MDVIQSRIVRGELNHNATIADALAGYGLSISTEDNDRTLVAKLMGFAEERCGSAFRRDNPELYEELDKLFNEEIPLFGYVHNQPALDERADTVLRSPLHVFYKITDISSNDENPKTGHRRYPQDAEALDLLEAAAKLKMKLTKSNAGISNNEVIQELLNEPDGCESKIHRGQRIKYQYRVWYGALKNGKRKNRAATPPERLDTKTKTAKWDKHYKDWGKHLSCFLNHPPAK